ncbi:MULTISPECIES: MFS transporter [Pseudoalteromonas]|uniref:MFS transporter n=1 Tax=Pseudoalteromonas fuliginea TaxID=1872678 RepID=A0ABQ6RC82_9GAMM|nr:MULTISPECIES: MFS transporter [Pseudoalteromonas]KAA1150139.1 MFS transporter [Pseudoalteromonas fuliginea]KAA1164877.1 MFS transporter [Pseudoalteromonas fuliginea]KDC55452.1 major facilitator transporter [Pseudoalteromonas sp. S3431]
MRLPHLLVCSVFIFFVLYAPQPLLSLFANEFNVAPAVAGSLMTATMLPLAIAPLVYGVLLAKRNPLLVLRIAMVFLGLSSLLFIYVPSFELLLLVRFLQGLTLPAALTAMTSYIGMSYSADALQKNMTLYIGSSIVGGYFGRVLAALFSDLWHWQSFYYVIAFMLIFLALTIKHSRFSNPTTPSQLSPLDYLKQLKEGAVLKVYGAVFCMFFCFAALLNYLPFILQNTFLITNTRDIGLVYSGYLIGALASITAPWLLKKTTSAWHLLVAVFSFYSVSIILLMSHQLSLFLIAFTLFCGAMFVIHSTAAPLVNKISKAPPSVTNGGYVSFYYSGGALGSLLPGVVYQHYGQTAFMFTLLAVCLCGLSLIVWAYFEGKNTTRG